MKKFICVLNLTLISIMSFAQPRLPEHTIGINYQMVLEVVVIENDKVPLVTIEIAVKNGAFTEDSNYNGLSHLF
ncbi:MAG: hypothetical protein WDM78_23475 [Puia sp.]